MSLRTPFYVLFALVILLATFIVQAAPVSNAPQKPSTITAPAPRPVSTACYASTVVDYVPGTRATAEIMPERADPSRALAMPERDGAETFTALGDGGVLTLSFEPNVIVNQKGADFTLVQSIDEDQTATSKDVFVVVSLDEVTWVTLGYTSIDSAETAFDLGSMTSIRYIRIYVLTSKSAPNDEAHIDGIIGHFCSASANDINLPLTASTSR